MTEPASRGANRRWDLTAIGDLNADLILADPAATPVLGREVLVRDGLLTLGGATALLAADAARLGLSVRLVAKVGGDSLGSLLLGELRQAGVDTSLVLVDRSARTGVTVSLTYPHDRALVTYAGPVATLTASEIPAAALVDTRHVHVSSYFLQEALRPGLPGLFRAARAAGATTSLDTGDDPSDRWDDGLLAVLEAVDLFFPNEREATRIGGAADPPSALARLAQLVAGVVVKLGPAGAIARVGGEPLRTPAYPVETVDTTGAGDAFNAGYLFGYLRSQPAATCLELGAAAGALATTWLGGQSPNLTAAAVVQLRATRRTG